MLERLAHIVKSKTTKRIILFFWLALVLCAVLAYFIYPQYFTANSIKSFLTSYGSAALVVYTIICLVRGIFLIPSTPFVLAGALLFPKQLVLVFVISIIGILCSGTFIYYAANFLDFEQNESERVAKIKRKINKYGFWIVLGWAFFPIVPTDLICYVAGKTKMHFGKYIFALFIGEAILISVYLMFSSYFV